MNAKLESLGKILRLEKESGFRDSTVVGGMDRFLDRWAEVIRPALGDLGPYSALTPEQRERWVDRALGRLPAMAGEGTGQPTGTHRDGGTRPRASRRPPPRLSLDDEVTRLKGVSTRNLTKLKRLGVARVRDLVYLFPSRHNDFTNVRKISELQAGVEQTVVVSVWEATETGKGPRRRSTQAILGDDTGNVRAIWFNNPYLARTLRSGAKVVISGKVSVFRGRLVFESPEYEMISGQDELVHTGRLVPVYPSTEGLPQRTLRRLVKQALDATVSQVAEFLPESLVHRTALIGLRNAVAQAHYPDSEADWNAARRRLAFDELFLLQLAVLSRKRDWQQGGQAVPLAAVSGEHNAFLESLPFSLTDAQNRVLDEILQDLREIRPMSRLLQGDVGSGKTVVAVAAMVVAALEGYQAALMVPTEILAEQHFLTLAHLLSGVRPQDGEEDLVSVMVGGLERPLTVGLLSGSLPSKAKEKMRQRVAAHDVDIVIGTHTLIQSSVEMPRLALVVVDEQHRFGVMQRSSLREKGRRPHLLAMSATPIPRSLALTLYGDLEISVIDELPPGRQRIRTRWVEPSRKDAAYGFVRKQVKEGRQAFVVCPLIEESEAIQSRAAVEEHQRLSTDVFPDIRLGLLHGRMPLQDKQQAMREFQRGDLDVLVCTPVVEVGIDVANATVMLVDGADRFGLAQLHQFRGRVGRGVHQSYCLLLADSPGEEARERLKVVERVHDGFELAEEDLRLRGPGDYMGTRQSGLPSFRVARITDQDILAIARREAAKLQESDPDLSNPENASLAQEFALYGTALAGEAS